jgi:hypothetical protein
MFAPMLSLTDFIQVTAAIHLSSRVDAPYTDRGGMIVVGPPGSLKSTVITIVAEHYPDALLLSDINAQMLAQIRDTLTGSSVRTLVIPEMAKLYQRHSATASNVEGYLQALAGEGFSHAAHEDSRVATLKARATILSAITPHSRLAHFPKWEGAGFNRRFLWPLIQLHQPEVLELAVLEWRRLTFGQAALPPLPLGPGELIPSSTTRAERDAILQMVRAQPGGSNTIHLQLMTRALSVLRWWYRHAGIKRNAMEPLRAFAQALGKEGTSLVLPDQGFKKLRRRSVRRPKAKGRK